MCNSRGFLGWVLVVLMGLSAQAETPKPAGPPRDFYKPGLIYFWALNDACTDATIDRFVDAFAKGGISAVCLHPRPGLLKPYGGDAWFEFIRRTVDRCAARGLDVWLYDEDPWPSGNCGGWITTDHPEYRAMDIQRYEPKPAPESKGLYCFPSGKLLWCGLVDEGTGKTVDLTGRVGLVRRKWIKLDPWDSRYYYPATPLHSCPRAWTLEPEFAVEVSEIPKGSKLLAFVAQPVASDVWAAEPDRLNPACTQEFLKRTHERYAAVVGDRFGKQVRAMFTDEPKYSSAQPWTRDMFPSFRKEFGYDLGPRLWQLFSQTNDVQSILTRLHFRQWCGERFRTAWVEPVSRWCREHGLAMLGHISPEDDPLQQAQCVSNLFPLHADFDLPGLDLIIPAVGDGKHPLINIGVLSATSCAQQLNKAGVMSESLACSGLKFTAEEAGRILRWQLMMGVTAPVVHCAYNSVEGLRRIEAPPDFGPASDRWEGMVRLNRELAGLQAIVRDATQVAPVAIVWPIRSFAALPPTAFTADCPLRNDLVRLIQLCLDRQVGIQLLDEADLWRAGLADGHLRLGRASYSHVLLPPSMVLHARTIAKLREAGAAGVTVLRAGQSPKWQQTDAGLEPAQLDWCPAAEPAEAVKRLPRLAEIGPDAADIRCTAWRPAMASSNPARAGGGTTTRLLMNLRSTPAQVTVDGKAMVLAPGAIEVIGRGP